MDMHESTPDLGPRQIVEHLWSLAHDEQGPHRFLLMLVLADAIVDRASLRAATSSSSSLYRSAGGVRLEWTIGPFRDARYLSSATTAWVAAHGHRVGPSAWTRLSAWLHRHAGITIAELMAASSAWWAHRLPGDLYLHASRQRPFQLLGRAALARRAAELPLATHASSTPTPIDLLDLCRATRSGKTAPVWLIDFRRHAARQIAGRRSVAETTSRLRAFIEQSRGQAIEGGTASLIAWLALDHLTSVRSGGRALRPRTIAEYARFVEMLRAAFPADTPISALDGEEWLQLYGRVIDACPETQRAKACAVFDQVHMNLVASAGAELLPRHLDGRRLNLAPHASIVWPHEFDRATEFIATVAAADSVLLQQADLIIRLAWHLPLRINDIMSLRLMDVSEAPTTTTLTVSSSAALGGAKAPATRRSVDLGDEALVRALRQVVRRRLREGAEARERLFASARNPRVLEREAETWRLVQSALTWATGDASVTFYSLRHACLTRTRLLLEQQAGQFDVRTDARMAAVAGHASLDAWTSYFHAADELLLAYCRLARPDGGDSMPEGAESIPPVTEGLTFCEPQRPISLASEMPRGPLRFAEVLELTVDIVNLVELERIADRFRVDLDLLGRVIQSLWRALIESGQVQEQDWSRPASRSTLAQFRTWARATSQPKCTPLARTIAQWHDVGQRATCTDLWQSWRQLQHREHLRIGADRASEVLCQLAERAGAVDHLVVATCEPRPVLVRGLRMVTQVQVASRPGRPKTRLWLRSDRVNSSNAAMSVVGLHWLVLVMRTCMLIEGRDDDRLR